MCEGADFSGFGKDAILLLVELAHNNNKEWFHSHKSEFEAQLIEPARRFVTEITQMLKAVSPTTNGIPTVGKSISRMNRDIRFSKDKSPYRTHLDVWFWDGETKSFECSGFIFRLSAHELMFGTGILEFSKEALVQYRDAVADDKKGAKLVSILRGVEKIQNGHYHGSTYKRMPKGYEDVPQNRGALLLHSGLYADIITDTSAIFSREFLTFATDQFRQLEPLHGWIRGVVKG